MVFPWLKEARRYLSTSASADKDVSASREAYEELRSAVGSVIAFLEEPANRPGLPGTQVLSGVVMKAEKLGGIFLTEVSVRFPGGGTGFSSKASLPLLEQLPIDSKVHLTVRIDA